MESTFWSVQVKQAWDSVPLLPEAQSPLLPSFSEDSGPWPLPFYPVLGTFLSEDCSEDGCDNGGDNDGDYEEQPLLLWHDDFEGIDPRTDSCWIQSTSEPIVPDSVNTFLEEQREKTATPGTREDAAEEPFAVAMQLRSCSRAPHRGDDALDSETCGGSPSSECQRLAFRDWRSRLGTRSGRILRRVLACLPCGCCLPAFGSREP